MSLTVSPEAWELFRRQAQKLGMTRSELVELIAKNQIPLLSALERETAGGIARQLIEKIREQLAYHKTQASELEARLQELEEFTEGLEAQDIEEEK